MASSLPRLRHAPASGWVPSSADNATKSHPAPLDLDVAACGTARPDLLTTRRCRKVAWPAICGLCRQADRKPRWCTGMSTRAPLRCGIWRTGAVALRDRWTRNPCRVRSDCLREFWDRCGDPQRGWGAEPELVVAASKVLHEGVSSDDDLRCLVRSQAAYRSQPVLQPAVISLDRIVRVPLDVATSLQAGIGTRRMPTLAASPGVGGQRASSLKHACTQPTQQTLLLFAMAAATLLTNGAFPNRRGRTEGSTPDDSPPA